MKQIGDLRFTWYMILDSCVTDVIEYHIFQKKTRALTMKEFILTLFPLPPLPPLLSPSLEKKYHDSTTDKQI